MRIQLGQLDGPELVKLASLSRVSHLAAMRDQWVRAMRGPIDLRISDLVRGNIADATMIDAITPALHAEIQRRIDVIDVELVELGMSID
ncbi:MAG: hypothetical protein KYX66_23425 [Blastomonas fulva]|uniref:hypothetical protein n=1 Tax=Blastomonas fulva TaxID=1550728 RepID=UPI0024E26E0A|nr:hypothetical protein [Blastomonas fulva]MDK2759675.1 hypothetical protein [Blastomonas fulva]